MTRASGLPTDSDWWWMAGVVCLVLKTGPTAVGDDGAVVDGDAAVALPAAVQLGVRPRLAFRDGAVALICDER